MRVAFHAVNFARAAAAVAALLVACTSAYSDVAVRVSTPMEPPDWALLERALLQANADACEEFFARYFDERGFLMCVERWGGDDGPDDAIENCNDWPILHALGGSDRILHMYRQAWEGHLRQYTRAKTTDVPFARDGMYYKEFPVMFDWQHNAEGLSVFNLQGLSDPLDSKFRERVRRFAGFYVGEDSTAANYDPEHRIIRSLFNGSRGPLLRKATAVDWAGDPIEIAGRFQLRHGERSYEEMLAHFEDYTDIVGDHPLNLLATTLPLNAYMLTHEDKYKRWLLEYVDAWADRMSANGGIIPSNIGLDGTIGGECDGKWYGGTYGWGFTVVVPQTGELADRNRHNRGFVGFINAYLLTGDDRYLDAWRKQADAINANAREINGTIMYPRMHGDEGWYAFTPQKYSLNAREIYYLSMEPDDLQRAPHSPWFAYLQGDNPDYPQQALRSDFARIRQRIAGVRSDPTTPDTRLADDPMEFNPASVTSLLELMMGGLYLPRLASVLHSRLRYFDPVRRRAGIPEDVAALVEKMSATETVVSLVNVNQVEPRTLIVQAGSYAEHRFDTVTVNGQPLSIDASHFTVHLEPGCGSRLLIRMQRYANPPTLSFPWHRE